MLLIRDGDLLHACTECRARLGGSVGTPDTDPHAVAKIKVVGNQAPSTLTAGMLALPMPTTAAVTAVRKGGVQWQGVGGSQQGSADDASVEAGSALDSPKKKASPRKKKSSKNVGGCIR